MREEVLRVVGKGVASAARTSASFRCSMRLFQEAMRLYSPVPILMRRTIAPSRSAASALKKGATVIVPIYVVHRHRKLWQDPLKFDPSRFCSRSEGRPPSLRLYAVRRWP